MNGRRFAVLTATAISILGLTDIETLKPSPHLIWNRTESAPVGLYWLERRLPPLEGWALLSPDSDAAMWIAAHGFLATDWPIIKRVCAVSGDKLCRSGRDTYVNGAIVTQALARANATIELPKWSGCRLLGAHDFLLLNNHERSLDGRYFGVTEDKEIDGTLVLIVEAPSWLR